MDNSADFKTLYLQAVETAAKAKEARIALEENPEEFAARVTAVRDDLKHAILAEAPAKIMAAASNGLSMTDVYRFNGNDALDDISVLFLIKGQRPRMPPPPAGVPGPLLPDLQEAMAPFALVHDWDGITGGNRLVARWVS